jgi:hypothetical protein
MPFQAQFDEIGNTFRVSDRLGNGIELPLSDLKMDVRIGLDILEPVRLTSAC